MDHSKYPKLIAQLYTIVGELEAMFGRHFTPDGHMVGSIGESLAAYYYGLELTPPSTKGCDAIKDELRIEIKATQGTRVALRSEPQHLLVLKLERDGSFEEVYNGLGKRVWAKVKDRALPSNGQRAVTLAMLRRLQEEVTPGEALERVR